ncbi:hypothetical protein ACEPAG_7498 [Sanghuangporus baumii]
MENVDVDAAIKVVNDILDRIAANPTLDFGPEGMPEDIRTLLMTLEELPTPPMGNPLNRTANYPLSLQKAPSVASSEAFEQGHKPSTSIEPPPESWNEPQAKGGKAGQHLMDHCTDEVSMHTDNERITGNKEQSTCHGPTGANYVAWTGQRPATLSNSYQGSPYEGTNESITSDGRYMKDMTYLLSHDGGDLHPRFYPMTPDCVLPAAPDLKLMQQSVRERPRDIPIAVSNRMSVGKSKDVTGGSDLSYRSSLNDGDDKGSKPGLLVPSSSVPSSSVPSLPNAAISLFGGLQPDGGYNNTAWDSRAQVRTIGPPASIRDRAFLTPSGHSSLVSLSPPTYYPPPALSSVHMSHTRIGSKRRCKKERKTKTRNAFGSGTGIRCRLPNCNIPDYEFASRKELQRHQDYAAVHGGIRARCPKCDKEYSREDAVLRHMKRAHPSIDVGV